MKCFKMMWIVFFVTALFFCSCNEKVGCTDPTAENYCNECKKEDHSCVFKGEVVFWFNETSSQSLLKNGVTSLTCYLDGRVVASSATNVYWTDAPDCGQNGTMTISQYLGHVKTRSSEFVIEDQNGVARWEGILNFNAATCEEIKLNHK